MQQKVACQHQCAHDLLGEAQHIDSWHEITHWNGRQTCYTGHAVPEAQLCCNGSGKMKCVSASKSVSCLPVGLPGSCKPEIDLLCADIEEGESKLADCISDAIASSENADHASGEPACSCGNVLRGFSLQS